MIFLPKGAIISCPECEQELHTIVRDIERGEPTLVCSDAFEPIGSAPKLTIGVRLICFHCDEPFVDSRGGWHTKNGWVR